MNVSLKNIDNLSLEQLLKLKEEHPYFSLVNAASSKKMKSLPYFKAELSRASIFSADRNQLRKYIEQDITINSPLSEEVELVEDKAVENAFTVQHIENVDFTKASFTFNQWLNVFTPAATNTQETSKPLDDLDKLILHSAQSAQFMTESLKQETSYSKGLDTFLEGEKYRHKIKKSSLDETKIVSETLAKLYIAQGKNNMAVEVFEKLMLKYPEKSIYFAQQIQKIKK